VSLSDSVLHCTRTRTAKSPGSICPPITRVLCSCCTVGPLHPQLGCNGMQECLGVCCVCLLCLSAVSVAYQGRQISVVGLSEGAICVGLHRPYRVFVQLCTI
jgi:hypothetical protein